MEIINRKEEEIPPPSKMPNAAMLGCDVPYFLLSLVVRQGAEKEEKCNAALDLLLYKHKPINPKLRCK